MCVYKRGTHTHTQTDVLRSKRQTERESGMEKEEEKIRHICIGIERL